MRSLFLGLIFLAVLASCTNTEKKAPPLFEEIKPDSSGVAFTNALTLTRTSMSSPTGISIMEVASPSET